MSTLRRALLTMAIAIGLLALMPFRAFADAAVPITTDSNSLAQLKLSPVFFSLITAQFIPLVTGYLTKLATKSWQKHLLTLLLSAIQAVIGAAVFVGGSYVFTKETVITTLLAWIASSTTYNGLWKKLGLTSSAIELPHPTEPGQTVSVPGKLASVGLK